jgi:ethanolaminephosphotransferase
MRRYYLNEEALTNLKNYKYVAGMYSPFDNLLTPFWNKCVTFLPMWMAPNLVTLTGLGIQVFNLLYILTQDLSMTKQLPPWVYVASALCLFVYQTMDAIDGKQARRTKTASPLGQLFDHGCDAFSSFLCAYITLQIWKITPADPIFYIMMTLSLGLFYMGTFEEYHLGVVRTAQPFGPFVVGLTEI